MDLNAWLDSTNLVVCVGSGGVGKTTTSAAIGLRGAVRGRKVMVLTIDPAKRLANSLGLKRFSGEGQQIDLSALPEAKGELWAMMLDSKSTFDNVIARVSPNEEVRDRILNNRLYRVMADTFAGSQEYMATEKLYDIVHSGEFDLVVLDTPPVKNALDFLESPGRIVDFLDERVFGWLLEPEDSRGLFGMRIISGAGGVVFKLLGLVMGAEFLNDFKEFLSDFKELYDGFRQRHDAVMALFNREDTQFVTVCAPTESSVDVASFFQDELGARELPRGGVVVNQIHRCEDASHDAEGALGAPAREMAGDLDEKTVKRLLARLGMAHRRLRELSEAEHAMVERVRRHARGGGFYQEVPRLDDEVNDLKSLNLVGENLFVENAEEL
ncbi:MAG: ArsA family ATPase [Deltaproteobacteria bacterium]|nr:MAG: ArsA family ATPase [Deltaproteobacteria bacterium]